MTQKERMLAGLPYRANDPELKQIRAENKLRVARYNQLTRNQEEEMSQLIKEILGGTGKETGKRHPTLGNGVMVGSGAKVLGPFTVGDNSKIASNAVVLTEIPPNSTAVGVPARVVRQNGIRVSDLDQIHIPDPVNAELVRLQQKIADLQEQVAALTQQMNNQNSKFQKES